MPSEKVTKLQHSYEFLEKVSAAKVRQARMITSNFQVAWRPTHSEPHLTKCDVRLRIPRKRENPLQMALLFHSESCEYAGFRYYDSVSIKVVDDRTIEEVDQKNGKTVATSKTWVSSDGNTMMFEFSDSSATNADPVTGKGSETRVSKGPAGSHAISGSWRMAKMESLSENGLVITYRVTGDS